MGSIVGGLYRHWANTPEEIEDIVYQANWPRLFDGQGKSLANPDRKEKTVGLRMYMLSLPVEGLGIKSAKWRHTRSANRKKCLSRLTAHMAAHVNDFKGMISPFAFLGRLQPNLGDWQ